MSRETRALAKSPLFQTISARLPHNERVHLAYKRAIAIGKAYNLTAEDIVKTSPRYWQFHMDPILPMDGAATSLLIIHLNLCIGTLGRYAIGQPHLQRLLKKMLAFQVFGQFCLTEQAHGLDARNLETTATLMPDGSIDLHTPHDGAAKHMPPTSPCGIPTTAVVFARFIVNGQDRGVKPFHVMLHDGHTMCQGITSRLLTPRGGSAPMDHCLTYFNHVSLPSTALLGFPKEEGQDTRSQFFEGIYRVVVGTLLMGIMMPSSLKMAAYVAGRYSQRRKVTDALTGKMMPIISFPTQHYPVLSAIAQAIIFQSFNKKAITLFTNRALNLTTRHCIAAITKATLGKHCAASLISLGERCGAQGLFEVNQFSVQYADLRGAVIAEGDVLGISIRFGIELLLKRIELPASQNPDGLLARRVTSLLHELRSTVTTQFKHHRDPGFQEYVLPHCQPLIEAIGYSMAYDAAVADGIDQAVVDMFVASVVREDRAWFTEVAGISRAAQMDRERNAMQALLPRLDELLVELDVEDYCTAPIICDEKWNQHIRTLPAFTSASGSSQSTAVRFDGVISARAML